MKHKRFLCGIAVLVMAAMGQVAFAQVGATGNKPAAGEASPAMAALQTAYSLAKYGYANESASALIGAAEILAQTIWKNEKTGVLSCT